MATEVIDMDRIKDAADGDAEFLRELVAVYIDDASSKVQEIGSAIAKQDALGLGRMAHQLKGASANVGAVGVSHFAKQLEALGKANDLKAAEALLPGLQTEFQRVTHALERMIAAA